MLSIVTSSGRSDGQRLDRFLVSVLADHSRSQIQKLITDGHVHRAERPPARSARAREGQPAGARGRSRRRRRARRRRRRPLGAEALPLDILYQDADLAVLEQAGGHGRASRRRTRIGHARQRAAPPPHRSQRHRRRAAAGHRAPARSRHVGRHGGRQERRAPIRSCRVSFTIARSRRNTSRWSGASCRPGAASTRRSDAIRPTGRRCRRAPSTRATR